VFLALGPWGLAVGLPAAWSLGLAALFLGSAGLSLWASWRQLVGRSRSDRDCEEALADTRDLLEQTGRMARVGGWFIDVPSMRLQWTREVYRIHEVPFEAQPCVEEAVEFFVPPGRDRLREAITRAIEAGEPYDLVLPFVTAKGNHRWVRTLCRPVMEGGRTAHLRGTFQDITEQVEATRKSQTFERQLKTFVEHSPAAVAMFDREMRYLIASRGWYEQYEIQGQDIIGRTHYEVFPTVPERWKQLYQRALAGETLSKERDHFEVEDGQTLWVRWELRPWHDHDGRVGGLIMYTEVINHQIQHERHLHEARQAAEAASLAKSEFLANMSHEVRTPMTAILGFTEALDEGMIDDREQVRQAFTTIQSNARHLMTVIDDILDTSKIEAGQMKVELAPVRPLTIVRQVVDLLRKQARGKGLTLDARCDSAVPEKVQTDPTRLRQVLMNLLGNAIKFTEMGSVTVRVSCCTRREELRIDVIDTGIGMSSQQLAEVTRFAAFTQAQTSMTRRYGGSGLGLRIANSLAQMLGGDIVAGSAPGRGSTFVVRIGTGDLAGVEMIDARVATERLRGVELQHAAAQGLPVRAPDALTQRRVLLVEDGPDNQRLINLYLKKAGASVTIAEHGQAALDQVQQAGEAGTPFDLILMDMQMPVMDGYQATRRLREQGVATPIIALTAHAMKGDQEKCFAAGCNDYLTKPVQRELLIERCRQAAGEQGQRGAV